MNGRGSNPQDDAAAVEPAAVGWLRLSHVLMLQWNLMRRLNEPPSVWLEKDKGAAQHWVTGCPSLLNVYYSVLCLRQCAHYSSKKKNSTLKRLLNCEHCATEQDFPN